MARTSFLATFFVAVGSVLLFSGQIGRPFVQPQPQRAVQQPQQRQTASAQQRQTVPQGQQQTTMPPRPGTPPPNPAPPAVSVTPEMPAIYLLPDDIRFPDMPPGASPTITLFGDPRGEGLYVTRTFIPHGVQTIPHIHSDSRTVTVLSGVCYYIRGEVFDEDKVKPIPMPSGSFFTEPAGVPHYIWAKDGDVIVQTTAIGPSGTQLAPNRAVNTVRP